MLQSGWLGRRSWMGSAACLVLAGLISGCDSGPVTGDVAGTVTLDGQPYTDSAVMFLSAETGQGGGADIMSDGTFKLERPLPVGSYKVFLAPKSVPPDAPPTPVTIDKSVPQKYWNEATTDITATVNEGENKVDVTLKS